MFAGCLVGFTLLAAAVEVEGSTSCPSAAQVSERLGSLLPPRPTGAESGRARLWSQGDEVVVQLDAADGSVVGTRRFPQTYACEDLASAIAVSLAAWASDVHPAFAPQLEAQPPPRLATTAVPVVVAARRPEQPASPPLNFAVGVGAGVAASVASSDVADVAGDVVVAAWLRPSGWWLSPRLELDGQTQRRVSLSQGAASWRRFSLGVGVERTLVGQAGYRGADGEGWLRAFVLARLAWLDLRGDGFPANRDDSVLDPGASAGLRAVALRGRWQPWVEIAGTLWIVRHDLAATGLGDLGHLPRGELFARLGVAIASLR